jgi:hypothetical protein
MTGIVVMLLGIALVFYSASQFDGIMMNDEYLITRAIMILGFVMITGGGLITLSPFGKK